MSGPSRIVIIGDTHLDTTHERNGDRLDAWDQIIDVALDRDGVDGRLAAWVHVGDVYDSKSEPDDRNEAAKRLRRMGKWAPVLVVAGNHDAPNDLRILGHLEAEHGITVVERPELVRTQTILDDQLLVAALPYPHKAGLVGAGVPYEQLGDAARAALEPWFLQAGAEFTLNTQRLPLFVGHVNVGGARVSTGQPSIGKELELDPLLLARLGDVPKVLGHIHLPQELHGATFVGSSARMNFGEMEAKRFLIVEYDSPTSWRIVSVPLEVPAQLQVTGRLTREAFVPTEPIGDVAGADVRVKYSYVRAELAALDVAHIHAMFAGCRSLSLEGVPESVITVRAPEVAAATTLHEKVQRCADRMGVTWTDGLDQKFSMLQTSTSEALLASVSAELAGAGAQPGHVERAQEVA